MNYYHSMHIRILILLSIAITIAACNNTTKDSQTEKSEIFLYDTLKQTKSEASDTEVDYTLVIRGKKNQLIIPERKIEYFDELQNFIDLYGKHMIFHHEYLADVTGDGLKNKCITHVEKKDKGYLASNTISHGNNYIWHDTLLMVREKIDFFWSETPDLFNQLEEWLLFFEAYRSARNFTHDFQAFLESATLWDMYLHSLAVTGESDEENMEYLKSFKGNGVMKMCIWAPSFSIWHPKVNGFIEIYAP